MMKTVVVKSIIRLRRTSTDIDVKLTMWYTEQEYGAEVLLVYLVSPCDIVGLTFSILDVRPMVLICENILILCHLTRKMEITHMQLAFYTFYCHNVQAVSLPHYIIKRL